MPVDLCHQFLGVLFRCDVSDRAVWSLGVVFDPPKLDDPASLCHRDEPMLVQALIAELAIEGFDEAVVGRLAGREKSSTTPFW